MGTTQRLVPGITGEPNWGNLNRVVTGIARTIEREKELEKEKEEENEEQSSQEDGANDSIKRIEKRQRQLNKRKHNQIRSSVKRLFLTGGGRTTVSSGQSRSIGKAGRSSSKKIAAFLSDVRSAGLGQALEQRGFGSLAGKSVDSIIDFLTVFCSDSSVGMDETAASKASALVFRDLASNAETPEDMESIMQERLSGNGSAEVICLFFGHYIFEHLSQRFEEKITEKKGVDVSKETFETIHKDIVGQIKNMNYEKSVAGIDWRGQEGEAIIQDIFDSIISLF